MKTASAITISWARAALLLLGLGSIPGCQEDGRSLVAEEVADPIADTLGMEDSFRTVDLGAAITPEGMGLPSGRSIADASAVLLDDGRVRLYFFAQKEGISCAVSEDGIQFTPEATGLLHEGYGMPRAVRLEDGRIRMFVSDWRGVWSAVSEDGISFTLEEGLRLTTEESGFDRIGKFTIFPLAEGGYRAYLHQLSIPGANTDTVHKIRSAVSADQLSWVMEEGIRIGPGSEFLSDPSREPFPLARADGGVTLIFTNVAQLPTSLYTSTSTNGITFVQQVPVNLDGAGPFVLRLATDRYHLYYDAHDDELGYHVRVAEIELDP